MTVDLQALDQAWQQRMLERDADGPAVLRNDWRINLVDLDKAIADLGFEREVVGAPPVTSDRETALALDVAAGVAEADLMRRDFGAFCRGAWHVVEPELELREGLHLDAICEHLQAIHEGRIRKLLINIPPGHAKSLIIAVLFPAWVWLSRPTWRALFASYSRPLAIRDSTRCRRLIRSPWYQQTFRPEWKLAGDQNVKSYFENDAGGIRLALACGAKGEGTGYRGDAIFVDDPHSAEQAESELDRERAKRWFDKTYTSRLNDKRVGVQVVVGQRLHLDDLSAHLLNEKTGWEHLNLPTEFNPEQRCTTAIGWTDPRTEAGELLFPALFPREVVEEIREELRESGFAAQHNQSPVPPGGRTVKEAWICEVNSLPDRFGQLIQSWDLSLGSTKKGASYCVGQVWGKLGPHLYLIDQVRGRWELPEILDRVRALSAKHPGAKTKVVEDKAHGASVLQMLKREIPGLVPVSPDRDKLHRLIAVLPWFEGSNVHIPKYAPWRDAWVYELTAFPGAPNDDQVDATTQALAYLTKPRRKVSVSILGGR